MDSPTLDLRRQLRAMQRGWWLYMLALAVMLGLATYYACNKQDQYKIKGMVLIEDEKESAAGLRAMGGMAQMMRSFSIGGFSSNVDNEWLVMTSHDVRERAVKALGLNRTYVLRTGWLTKRLMYHDSPVLVDAPDTYFDALPRSWQLKVHLHDGKADITSSAGRFASNYWQVDGATLPCTVKTPYGALQLLKTKHYNPGADVDMVVNLASNNEMATWLHKQVSMEVTSKKGDAITLTIKDNRERGLDIINALIAAYNEKRADRRNEKAQAEVDFVNQRLAALQQELAESEGRVTRFKQHAGVSNPMVEAQGWLKVSTEAQAEAAQAQAELTVYEMILSTLRGTDRNAMLPAFEGVKDPAISQYNELVARRSTLSQSATDANAALEAIEAQIKPLRESIIKRAEKNIDAARVKLDAIYGQARQAQGRYNQMPAAEQQYYDLLRDRELKNDLYVFLLEKKESSLLKLGSKVTPSFILDNAYSTVKPDLTKTLIVFAIALLLALIGPTILLLWWQHRRDRVEQPCDLPSDLQQQTFVLGDDNDWLNMMSTAMSTPTPSILMLGDATEMAGEQLQTWLTRTGKQASLQHLGQWHEAATRYRLDEAAHKRVIILVKPRQVTRKMLRQAVDGIPSKDCIVGIIDNN